MKENFKAALDFVMAHECVFESGHYGDYAHVITENVSGDRGGTTKFGIDQRSHPNINIKALDYSGAQQLYRENEWAKCRCDDLPAGLDIAVFDTAVNCGIGTAVLLLQRALNDEDTQPALKEDGFIGPKTLTAAARNPAAIYHYLGIRDQRYLAIIEANPSQAKFRTGWLNRLADLGQTLNRFGHTTSNAIA